MKMLFFHSQAIEEIFKVTLIAPASETNPRITTPDLLAVRPQLAEGAARAWVQYYENERKCSYSNTERIQSQLQSVSLISDTISSL